MTFFDKYSFKQKNYALLILAVLLVAVSYKKAFSVSIETAKYRDELETSLIKAEYADEDIRSLQLQIARLNKYMGEENKSVEEVQQGFLNFFALNSRGLTVHQIDEVLNYKHPDFEINTHRIILRGDYNQLLRFIYTMEKDFALAKVLNVQFEFKRFSMEDEKHLYATLLMQNYIR